MIPTPYLLYLGDATDEISVKTSRGVAVWRPEICVGQYRRTPQAVSLGRQDMTFKDAAALGAKTLLLGVANAGGVLGPTAVDDAVAAIEAGMHVAAGLHDRLAKVDRIRDAAEANGRMLFDVREPPTDLKVGNGRKRPGKRLLTVGTDCSVGKMYTTLAIEKEMRSRGHKADFRATGQTGVLIAGSGIAVDAVVADFISGAAEILSPARDDGGWDLVEGQGSLFHASYAGVSLGLLHGSQPDALVMCHEPTRTEMRGLPGRALPDIAVCLEANLTAARLTNPDVIAVGVALNTWKMSDAEAEEACARISDRLGLPCQDPIRMGANQIVDRLESCFAPSA